MSKRTKMLIFLSCTVIAVLFGLFIYFSTRGPEVLVTKLPLPSVSNPYALVETEENYSPLSLFALLTDGQFALLREGSAGNQILSIAKSSKECAVLIEDGNENVIDIYAVLRLLPEDISSLSKGELPKSWKTILGNTEVIKSKEKGTWEIKTRNSSYPLYYSTEREVVIISQNKNSFLKLLNIKSGAEKGIPRNFWEKEKAWPAHIEICDGGLMFAEDSPESPLVLRAAWRSHDTDKKNDKMGEAIWRIKGLEKRISPLFLKSLKPKTWDTANCIIPEPLLISAGLNIDKLSGSQKDWPFPLNTAAEFGTTIGLSVKQIQKILSGETIFSIGGHNKLLWFSLPGFMVEFTGDKDLMKELVNAFWSRLFLGVEPKPMDGFDFGGTANVPFSVVGAGRENIAILGLLSPESIKATGRLDSFLKSDEKAIGWVIADLPRTGAALRDMTKMNAFMSDSSLDEDHSYGDDTEDIFQPDSSFSPFDQGISDSFGNVLKDMGKTLIVWETADSGRINWYKNSK